MKYIFFDLYTYNLKQAESIRKLWLRCCLWVTFFGTIFFIDRDDDLSWQSATVITEWDRCSSKYANNSRLMDTSCFIKLAVILVTINNMHFFYTACFFYHYLMVSLLFLSCLVINVLLTYRFTVHSTEKLVFPDIICQRHTPAWHALIISLSSWELETQANTRPSRVCITCTAEFPQVIFRVMNKTLTPGTRTTQMDCLWVFCFC